VSENALLETVKAALSGWTDSDLYDLTSRIEETLAPRHLRSVLEAVRKIAAEAETARVEASEHSPIVKVAVGTSEYDNGYFFRTDAAAYLADGTWLDIDLAHADDVMSPLGGHALDSTSELVVDLVANTVEIA
jgi:hypothetical protein